MRSNVDDLLVIRSPTAYQRDEEQQAARQKEARLHWRHFYPMLLCDRDDSLELRQRWRRGPDRRVCRTRAGFLDEPFHSRRRLNHKRSRRSASASAMGVHHALWKMNERSGASRESLAGQRKVEGPFEDVEALVAVAMDVRRWTELGSCRELCDGERTLVSSPTTLNVCRSVSSQKDLPSPLPR
jgi:hypothetical protein